jgi:hypothetical protein
MTDTTSTLDRLDDVLGGATNDELLELTHRVFEELAERVGNVSRLALDEEDRDLVNEAFTFASMARTFLPTMSRRERINDAWDHINDCKKKLEKAIDQRSSDDQPKYPIRGWAIRQTPASRRADEKKRLEDEKKAEKLLASIALTHETVLAAFRLAAADSGGIVQARDVALALCPDATPTETPGRQILIARVSKIIRELERDGALVRTSEANGRRTCRFAEAGATDAH